ncbi:hypothetical protein Tsubulata_023646, partial [Turnera subulata]
MLETFAKEALRRYNERMLQNLVFEELVRANVWVHFPMAYFITFLVNDGSSTRFRCKAHVAAPSGSKTGEFWKVDLFTVEKDGFFEVHNEAPYVKEMPAQSEKAVIPCQNSNHKILMEIEALMAKCLKKLAVILQAKSYVSDRMVLCASKAIRYEGGATGYRHEADTEMLAGESLFRARVIHDENRDGADAFRAAAEMGAIGFGLPKDAFTSPTKQVASQVGDVNIYMNDLDDPQLAEIEIMITEAK